MLNIAVGGANGKVGQLLVQLIQADKETHLAAAVIRADNNQNSLTTVAAPIDVFIDFSVPEAVMEHLAIACERSYPMVIGVTGFSASQKQAIIQASKLIPIVFAPNMSIGVNLQYKMLEMISRSLMDADIAILDIHHKHKKDSPSGTALHMAEVINRAQGKTEKESNIVFSSLRLGGSSAEVTAIFALEDERIEISHKAMNRGAFAKGATKAAKWLIHQPAGLYDMQAVLGLNSPASS